MGKIIINTIGEDCEVDIIEFFPQVEEFIENRLERFKKLGFSNQLVGVKAELQGLALEMIIWAQNNRPYLSGFNLSGVSDNETPTAEITIIKDPNIEG